MLKIYVINVAKLIFKVAFMSSLLQIEQISNKLESMFQWHPPTQSI